MTTPRIMTRYVLYIVFGIEHGGCVRGYRQDDAGFIVYPYLSVASLQYTIDGIPA